MSRRKYLEPAWHSVSYDSFAWKLVPVEPTEHMLDLGACFEDPNDFYGPSLDEGDLSRDVYRAMLEGAPEPPKGLQIAAAPDLPEALYECEEYFDNRADADCDQDGYIPNKEMKLLQVVRDAIRKAGA